MRNNTIINLDSVERVEVYVMYVEEKSMHFWVYEILERKHKKKIDEDGRRRRRR